MRRISGGRRGNFGKVVAWRMVWVEARCSGLGDRRNERIALRLADEGSRCDCCLVGCLIDRGGIAVDLKSQTDLGNECDCLILATMVSTRGDEYTCMVEVMSASGVAL